MLGAVRQGQVAKRLELPGVFKRVADKSRWRTLDRCSGFQRAWARL